MQAQADATKAQALEGKQAAQEEADRACQEVQQSDQLRQQAEAKKDQLRGRLRQQLNVIVETRETARGLIVNLSDVLFDTGMYTRNPGAREKMAKLSGVLLAYPGLRLKWKATRITLVVRNTTSGFRSSEPKPSVVAQGVPGAAVTATGSGKAEPVASNDTPAGRQQNRRVEIVVSGEPIGTDATDVY